MPAPLLSDFGQKLYALMASAALQDANNGWAVALLCGAAAVMWDDVNDMSREQDTLPGWAVTMEPDLAPANALSWLAQFAGVKFPSSATEDTRRQLLKTLPQMARGSPGAIVDAARVSGGLTGTQSVILVERDGNDPYRLTVNTRTSETTNATAVLAAIKTQKPVGINMSLNVIAGESYLEIRTRFATYTAMRGG